MLPRAEEKHLTKRGQFGWGLVGAAAPYVVRAVRSVRVDTEMPHVGLAFIIVTLGALAFGGAWSIAMKSDPAWKAVYNGATSQLMFVFLVETAR
jgi:hypothetical protein